MGETGVQQDKYGKEVTIYLAKCNDCEHDVRLSYTSKIEPEQLETLQKRMLCSSCLNKKLEVRK